jgi:predicted glutamine amidotransferase
MCGLVGVAGNITHIEKNLFRNLLKIDTIRGPDSTGVTCIEGNGDITTFKALGTGYDYFGHKKSDSVLAKPNTNVLIGHNRWATRGKINTVNAHPFEHGHIAGAHNGTLTTMNGLASHNLFGTDSEAVFYNMSTAEEEDHVIEDLHGAFALSWFNQKNFTLNLIRNSERPLFWAFNKDRTTLAWASEQWILGAAVDMVNGDYPDIIFCKPMRKYTFNIPRPKGEKPGYKFGDVIHTDIKEYEPPVSVVPDRDHGGITGKKIQTGSTDYSHTIGKLCKGDYVDAIILGVFSGKTRNYYIARLFGTDIRIRIYTKETLAECSARWNTQCNWSVRLAHYSPKLKTWVATATSAIPVAFQDCVTPFNIKSWDDISPDYVAVDKSGNGITKDEWEEMSNKDCSWCSDPISVEDACMAEIYGGGIIFCSDCAAKEYDKEYRCG